MHGFLTVWSFIRVIARSVPILSASSRSAVNAVNGRSQSTAAGGVLTQPAQPPLTAVAAGHHIQAADDHKNRPPGED